MRSPHVSALMAALMPSLRPRAAGQGITYRCTASSRDAPHAVRLSLSLSVNQYADCDKARFSPTVASRDMS